MKKIKQQEALSFDGLGIAPKLLEILTELSYLIPTPIQLQSIPVSLERKDIVGIAQTGTGKTLAFGIPMIQLLAVYKGMGLVLLPTRELALQVDEHLKIIGKIISLKHKPHIIIATPGRLIDHIQRRSVNLANVNILVLDEADMMLDMGFLPQIRDILKLVPKQRQTMLFSATMPSQIVKIASDYMVLPTRIEVAPAGTSAENVEQELVVIDKVSKFNHLKKILTETRGSVLIFMRTKHAVKTLTKKITQIGFSAAEIHSNRSLIQRRKALEGFKLGKFRILIATDIAARGIDVKEIELVVNYDLPEKSGDYVHRIGRTARAGKSGKAISFVMPSQIKNIREIEKLINKTLKINKTDSELNTLRASIDNNRSDGSTKTSFARGGVGIRKSFRANTKRDFGVQKRGEFYKKSFSSKTSGYSKKYKSYNRNKEEISSSRPKNSRKTNYQSAPNNSRLPMTDKERFRRSIL